MVSKSSEFSRLIADLKRLALEFSSQDINFGPLNQAIEKLELHLSDVEKLESELDAVRRQLIEPVQSAIVSSHRSATRFAIVTFVFGVILTIASVLISFRLGQNSETQLIKIDNEISQIKSTPPPKISTTEDVFQLLSNMEKKLVYLTNQRIGLNGNYTIAQDELELREYHKVDIGENSNGETIRIYADRIHEQTSGEGKEASLRAFARLTIYIGERRLGESSLLENITFKTKSPLTKIQDSQIIISEGEELILDNQINIVVRKILREKTRINPIADKYNAVVLKVGTPE